MKWMMGLHWINIYSKDLCKSKVSAKVSTKGVCSEWIEDALSHAHHVNQGFFRNLNAKKNFLITKGKKI
jgi:hypothetical protein